MTRPGRELTAAASRYTERIARSHRRGTAGWSNSGWQRRAWHFYGSVPEVRYAARWIGNAMGAARLYAARRAPDGTLDPAPDGHPAVEAVAAIGGGPTGQSQLLSAYGPHLVVAGEGWTVIHRTGPDTVEWHVLSTSEVAQQAGRLTTVINGEEVIIPAGDEERVDDTEAVAIRVWEPHPEMHMEADSPVRSSLPQLEELELLTAAIAAIARSRLTGRGLILIPKGATFPRPPGQVGEAEDDLIETFAEVAGIAIREPESAAATVPIILEVPPEMIDKIQRLTFESDFDRIAMELRQEAIRRFATGLEIPAEVVLGMADINHWGVWQLGQEAIRLGVEPRLGALADAYTTQWLQPVLRAGGLADADEWVVASDTSPLRVRANRAQTALELFDRGAISDVALRRETGFEESDAPAATAAPARPAPLQGGRPMLPADETTSEPATLPASTAALVLHDDQTGTPAVLAAAQAAADGLVWNALTMAGIRLRRSSAVRRERRAWANAIPAATLHTKVPVTLGMVQDHYLLEAAWDRLPEVAARHAMDAECLAQTLHEYVTGLLLTGTPHDYQRMCHLAAPCVGGSHG